MSAKARRRVRHPTRPHGKQVIKTPDGMIIPLPNIEMMDCGEEGCQDKFFSYRTKRAHMEETHQKNYTLPFDYPDFNEAQWRFMDNEQREKWINSHNVSS